MVIVFLKSLVISLIATVIIAPIAIIVLLATGFPPILVLLPVPILTFLTIFGICSEVFKEEEQAKKTIEATTLEIKKTPRNPALYLTRGDAYCKLRKRGLAIQDYSQVINLNPLNTTALQKRSEVYKSLGRYDEALHDCDRLFEILPCNYDVILQRSKIHRLTENYPAALKDLDRAIQVASTNPLAHQERANLCYCYLKDYEQAIRSFQALDRLSPILDLNTQKHWAESLHKVGRLEEAIEKYRAISAKTDNLSLKSDCDIYIRMIEGELKEKWTSSLQSFYPLSYLPQYLPGSSSAQFEDWCLRNDYEPEAPGSYEAWRDCNEQQRDSDRYSSSDDDQDNETYY